MPTIETNGFETYYERHGEGPPIVFVHGSGWDHRSWSPQVEGLADDYEVVTYDYRGHGHTESTDAGVVTSAIFADDLKALVDALGLDRPVVCGCSLGGRIAYAYAARYPDAISALIALEAAPNKSKEERPLWMRALVPVFAGLTRLLGANRVNALQRWVMSVIGSGDEFSDREVPGLGMTKDSYVDDATGKVDSAEQLKYGLAERVIVDLNDITVPTLVLTGADPWDTFEETAETLVAEIPDARRKQIPDAGHGAHMENPEAFNAVLREFLADVLDRATTMEAR